MNRSEFNTQRNKHKSESARLVLCYQFIDSLEEQNQGLQSLLDLKQQEISVLESKAGEVKTCFMCDHFEYCEVSLREDFFCSDYEPKQN